MPLTHLELDHLYAYELFPIFSHVGLGMCTQVVIAYQLLSTATSHIKEYRYNTALRLEKVEHFYSLFEFHFQSQQMPILC